MNLWAVAIVVVVLTVSLVLLTDGPRQLLVLLVFSTPLIQSVSLPYVGERVALFEPLFLLTVISIVTTMASNNDWRLKVPYEVIPIAGLAVVSGLSLFNSPAPANGLLLVVILIYYTGLLIVFSHLGTDLKTLRRMVNAYLAGSVVVIIAGLVGLVSLSLQIPTPFVGDVSNRVIATFREPNQLPAFLLTAFPIFLLHPSRHRSLRHRALMLLGAVAILTVILGSGSDGAMVVIVAEVAMIGVYKLYLGEIDIRTLGPAIGATAFGIIGIVMVYVSPVALPPAVENSLSIFFRDSYALRDLSHARYMQIMVAFPEAMQTHPILGIGAGSYHEFMIENYGSGNSLHNTYLGVTAESGLLGGVALFIFLMLVFRKISYILVNPVNKYWGMMGGGIIIGLFGLLLYGMVHYGLRQRQLWVLFGIVITLGTISKEYSND